MGDRAEPLTFGPSERYLPALQEGDALIFELNNFGKDVDTEWGSKSNFHNRTHRQILSRY